MAAKYLQFRMDHIKSFGRASHYRKLSLAVTAFGAKSMSSVYLFEYALVASIDIFE
jgi:hypothetical protein